MSILSYINEPDKSSPLKVTPVTGRIGAVVNDVRLSSKLDDDQIAAIRRALTRHKVLFFRDQDHLDDAGQEAFATRLGKVVAHPTVPAAAGTKGVLEIDSVHGYAASTWHTDVTFVDAYPEASILRGVVIPESGGDTLWANTAAAYQDFPDSLRTLADTLWAVHSNTYDYTALVANPSEEQLRFKSIFASTIYETEHPLVRIHPLSGERTLVLGHFLTKIAGVNTSESQHLFQMLQDHAVRPENTVRWHWRTGDVAIWDNRATQHRAVADFGPQRRHVRRVTLDGDVPISIDGRRSRTIKPAKAELAAAE